MKKKKNLYHTKSNNYYKKEVIQGEGFESNLDFSQHKLSMIHGVFDINVSSD